MKKTWLIVLIVIVALVAWAMSSRNSMVQARNEVELQLSNLSSAYQRRADLIPNLVEVAKGAAEAERATLNDVIEARSRATGVQLTPEMASDPQAMQQFQQAQQNLGSALSRLMVVVEKYPDLKSQANFQNLMVQLEGTENRINVSRNDYNASVRDYNTKIESFPGNMVAGMFGFQRFRPFEAAQGAENAPRVDFGTGGTSTAPPAGSGTPSTGRPTGPARPAPSPAPAR
ncbi:MAG TPA: LemA family protein [Candidatus Kapabacteria bacterium]|nr:LemA family protein [Candidatus Kapabacteria bacterium]